MQTPENDIKPQLARRAWIWWLLLAAGQGIVALAFYFSIPSEGGGFLVGLSTIRLILLGGILLLIGLALAAAASLWRSTNIPPHPAVRILQKLGRGRGWKWLLLLSVFGILAGAFIVLLTPEVSEPFARAYLERTLPLVFWFTGVCLQTIVILWIIFAGWDGVRSILHNRILLVSLVVWGFFLLVWAWVAWSQVGITVDPRGWNVQGAPVTEVHVFIAWLAGVVFLGLGVWISGSRHTIRPARLDWILAILLWLLAVGYWLAVPLPASWFVTEPLAPNYENYPNSDALIYDTTAQSMLVGAGFKSWNQPYARRPMYALFLGALRTVSGQDYASTTDLQVALLAFFPVLLYLLGTQLDNRLAGLVAGVLVILREGSGIAISGNITISHSRLLMSDFPNAFGAVLFCLLAVAWLKDAQHRRPYAFLAGAVLGTFMLIRPESGVLLVAALGIACLALLRRPKLLLQGAGLLVLGLVLVLAPWIWRNFRLGGQIFLEQPGNRLDFLFNRFEEVIGPDDSGPTPTPPATPASQLPVVPSGAELSLVSANYQPLAVPAAQTDQGGGLQELLSYVGTHFMHSQIQMALMLPDTQRLPDSLVSLAGHRSLSQFATSCCSTLNYVRRLPFWDIPWDGVLPRQSVVPLLVNLFVIALGISRAWYRVRWVGLLPLAITLCYTLLNAVARTSGGRYLLAVDWVPMLYYSLGFAQLALWGLEKLTRFQIPQAWLGLETAEVQPATLPAWRWGLPLVGLLALAVLLPMTEALVPVRYTTQANATRLNRMLEAGTIPGLDNNAALQDFIDQGGMVAFGRALYPRYYPAGEGAPGKPYTDAWAGMARPSFSRRDFDRMSFYLVGPQNMSVLLPVEAAPAGFQNAMDVVVVGCPTDSYLNAAAVGVFDPAGELKEIYMHGEDPAAPACRLTP
jgi:hypothetical protein